MFSSEDWGASVSGNWKLDDRAYVGSIIGRLTETQLVGLRYTDTCWELERGRAFYPFGASCTRGYRPTPDIMIFRGVRGTLAIT